MCSLTNWTLTTAASKQKHHNNSHLHQSSKYNHITVHHVHKLLKYIKDQSYSWQKA